jgi:hypothetical protein
VHRQPVCQPADVPWGVVVTACTLAAAGHDQHSGYKQVDPDMTGWVRVPRTAEPRIEEIAAQLAAHRDWIRKNPDAVCIC